MKPQAQQVELPCQFDNTEEVMNQDNSDQEIKVTRQIIKIRLPKNRKIVQQVEEMQMEKRENPIELPKYVKTCTSPQPYKIEHINPKHDYKQRKYALELYIEDTQKQGDIYYEQLVELYESSGNFDSKTITVNYGKKDQVQKIELLNYQTIQARLGKLCELCECNHSDMGRIYMIRSGSRILFLHAFCVYNSSGFRVNTKEGKIENLEAEMANLATKVCSLCAHPNASLQCAGFDKERCQVRFHANCLFNRKELGQVKEGPRIFCSKHKDKKQIKPSQQCSQPLKKQVKTDAQQPISQVRVPSRVQQLIQSAEHQILAERLDESQNRYEFMDMLKQQFGSLIAVAIINRIRNPKQEE